MQQRAAWTNSAHILTTQNLGRVDSRVDNIAVVSYSCTSAKEQSALALAKCERRDLIMPVSLLSP